MNNLNPKYPPEVIKYLKSVSRWFYLLMLVLLVVIALWALKAAAEPQPASTSSLEASESPLSVVPDPCGLDTVSCPEESSSIVRRLITTYQAVSEQTDSTPCIGALSGIDFCNPPYPLIANNELRLGTKVLVRGIVYVVADRLNPRFHDGRFDILTDGENFIWRNEPVTIL